MNLDLDAYAKFELDAILQKTIEERKKQEIAYHKERVHKLIAEKLELELKLLVLNETLRQIEELTKNNPLYKE